MVKNKMATQIVHISYGNSLFEVYLEKSAQGVDSCSLKCNEYSLSTRMSNDDADQNRHCLIERQNSQGTTIIMLARTSTAAILDSRVLTLAESGFRVPCILIGGRHVDDPSFFNLMLVTLLPYSSSGGVSGVSLKLSRYGRSLKIKKDVQVEPVLADGPIVYFFKHHNLYVNYFYGSPEVATLRININSQDAITSSVASTHSQSKIIALKATYRYSVSKLSTDLPPKEIRVPGPTDLTSLETGIVGRLDLVLSNDVSTSRLMTIDFKPKDKELLIRKDVGFPLDSLCYVPAASVGIFADNETDADAACDQTKSFGWSNIYLLTLNSQVVQIGSNLNVTKVCNLEIKTANKLLLYQRGSSSNSRSNQNYLIIKSDSDNTSCVLDLHSSKIIRTFKTSKVFVGDFIGRGEPDILVVQSTISDANNQPLVDSEVILLDLGKDLPNTITNEQPGSYEIESTEPSFLAAKEALNLRATMGRDAVAKIKDQLQQTRKMLEEASGTLREIAIGQEHNNLCSARNTHLFQLLNCEGKSRSSPIEVQKLPQRRPIGFGKPWKRIVDQYWVIGVEVLNQSKRPIFDLQLVLTTPKRSIIHTTNLFRMENHFQCETGTLKINPDENISPPPKRQKLNKECIRIAEVQNQLSNKKDCLLKSEKAFLTTHVDIQILQQESELPINVFINFRWHNDDTAKLTAGCLTCSPVRLTMHDLLVDGARINWIKEKDLPELLRDLAALDVTTREFQVSLVSIDTNLNDLSKCIQEAEFTYFGSKLPNVFVWTKADKLKILDGIWIEVATIQTNHKAQVTIHSRNRSQFFFCIEYLYSVFPKDVVIIPFQEEVDVVRPSITSSILQEVNLVTKFLDNNLSKSSSENQIEYVDKLEGNSKGVHISATNSYRDFRNSLLKIETKTDKLFGANCLTKKLFQMNLT